MLARRFFYVSVGLFLLALTYHLGARQADAQAPSNPVVGIAPSPGGGVLAVTSGGDTYHTNNDGAAWQYRGNVFGAPTSTTSTTWGKVKADYRK